jgi:hypothetical protein
MGMPSPVVQHAMSRDGLDPSVMDGDHNLPEPRCVLLQDDPTYSKYFKMLKLGLSMGGVKNAMESDGIDPFIMDGDHNALVSSSRRRYDNNDSWQTNPVRRFNFELDVPRRASGSLSHARAFCFFAISGGQSIFSRHELTLHFQSPTPSQILLETEGLIGTLDVHIGILGHLLKCYV